MRIISFWTIYFPAFKVSRCIEANVSYSRTTCNSRHSEMAFKLNNLLIFRSIFHCPNLIQIKKEDHENICSNDYCTSKLLIFLDILHTCMCDFLLHTNSEDFANIITDQWAERGIASSSKNIFSTRIIFESFEFNSIDVQRKNNYAILFSVHFIPHIRSTWWFLPFSTKRCLWSLALVCFNFHKIWEARISHIVFSCRLAVAENACGPIN